MLLIRRLCCGFTASYSLEFLICVFIRSIAAHEGNVRSVRASASELCVWNGTVTKDDPRTLLPAAELEKVSFTNLSTVMEL